MSKATQTLRRQRRMRGTVAMALAGFIAAYGGSGAATLRAQDAPASLSLAGKRIGITAIGTDHDWDLKAYQSQIDEVERLGGTPIALDAGRKDEQQIAQIQTLIAQKPDAIIEQLGNIKVLDPWLKRITSAGIPLFTVDTATPHSINNSTSDNYAIGSSIALQMISDIRGKGNILVFNGFYSVPVCAIRYDMLRYVTKSFPEVKIIEPELRDVIPNTVQNAYGQVTDMLTKYPEKGSISAIWACWDVPQVGATQALQAAGRNEVKVYGIDGSPEFIAMVQDPNSPAAAVMAQQPEEIGRTAVRNVAKYLNGDRSLPPFTFLPAVLVTKANAAEVVPTLTKK